MSGFQAVRGVAYPIHIDNIDTDIILPGKYLKTISRAGLGAVGFESMRALPGNVFADPRYSGAPILIAGQNFGCGSSREHAVWAIADLGIAVVIAESFSDIFAGNAFRNGLLAICLAKADIAALAEVADREIRVDLPTQRIEAFGISLAFEIDDFRKQLLLEGLDEIDLTLRQDDDITAYETNAATEQPWLWAAQSANSSTGVSSNLRTACT